MEVTAAVGLHFAMAPLVKILPANRYPVENSVLLMVSGQEPLLVLRKSHSSLFLST